jgi:hypothetical protein
VTKRKDVSMRKVSIIAVLFLMVLMTGCSGKEDKSKLESDTELQTQWATEESTETLLEESESTINQESEEPLSKKEQIREVVSGLEKDEYPELEITVAEKEMDALPGDTVNIEFTIENTGTKEISYTHGSGSRQIPQALMYETDGLQTIMPKDYLGAATLDMRMKILAPGEKLELTAAVRVMEPNDSFDEESYKLYQEEEKYIGDMTWDELHEKYPDFAAAKAGTYHAQIYFLYSVLEEETKDTLLTEATGYTQADVIIHVAGTDKAE